MLDDIVEEEAPTYVVPLGWLPRAWSFHPDEVEPLFRPGEDVVTVIAVPNLETRARRYLHSVGNPTDVPKFFAWSTHVEVESWDGGGNRKPSSQLIMLIDSNFLHWLLTDGSGFKDRLFIHEAHHLKAARDRFHGDPTGGLTSPLRDPEFLRATEDHVDLVQSGDALLADVVGESQDASGFSAPAPWTEEGYIREQFPIDEVLSAYFFYTRSGKTLDTGLPKLPRELKKEVEPLSSEYDVEPPVIGVLLRTYHRMYPAAKPSQVISFARSVLDAGWNRVPQFHEWVLGGNRQEFIGLFGRVDSPRALLEVQQAIPFAVWPFSSRQRALDWAMDLRDQMGHEACIETLNRLGEVLNRPHPSLDVDEFPFPEVLSNEDNLFEGFVLGQGTADYYGEQIPGLDQTWIDLFINRPAFPAGFSRIVFLPDVSGQTYGVTRSHSGDGTADFLRGTLVLPEELLALSPEQLIPLVATLSAYAYAIEFHAAPNLVHRHSMGIVHAAAVLDSFGPTEGSRSDVDLRLGVLDYLDQHDPDGSGFWPHFSAFVRSRMNQRGQVLPDMSWKLSFWFSRESESHGSVVRPRDAIPLLDRRRLERRMWQTWKNHPDFLAVLAHSLDEAELEPVLRALLIKGPTDPDAWSSMRRLPSIDELEMFRVQLATGEDVTQRDFLASGAYQVGLHLLQQYGASTALELFAASKFEDTPWYAWSSDAAPPSEFDDVREEMDVWVQIQEADRVYRQIQFLRSLGFVNDHLRELFSLPSQQVVNWLASTDGLRQRYAQETAKDARVALSYLDKLIGLWTAQYDQIGPQAGRSLFEAIQLLGLIKAQRERLLIGEGGASDIAQQRYRTSRRGRSSRDQPAHEKLRDDYTSKEGRLAAVGYAKEVIAKADHVGEAFWLSETSSDPNVALTQEAIQIAMDTSDGETLRPVLEYILSSREGSVLGERVYSLVELTTPERPGDAGSPSWVSLVERMYEEITGGSEGVARLSLADIQSSVAGGEGRSTEVDRSYRDLRTRLKSLGRTLARTSDETFLHLFGQEGSLSQELGTLVFIGENPELAYRLFQLDPDQFVRVMDLVSEYSVARLILGLQRTSLSQAESMEASIREEIARNEAYGLRDNMLSLAKLYIQTQARYGLRIQDESSRRQIVNAYVVLGIPKGATMDEIKRSYRQLALLFHPDRHQLNADMLVVEGEVKFATGSYEMLSNLHQRSIYDAKITDSPDAFPTKPVFLTSRN